MPKLSYPQSLEDALVFDAEDPLAEARSAFRLPPGVIYLVGHSLGPATQTALQASRDGAETDWAEGLVGSWNTADWIDLPATLGAPIARLIGVRSNEVIVCDSVTVNLFKLVGALIHRNPEDRRIIVETGEFPTDQYVLESLASQTGTNFVRAAAGHGPEEMKSGDILVRSLVDYRAAEVADVAALEGFATAKGATIVWDLSHATGVLDLNLAEAGARFAVGCTYKYLNGGPGAPAFIYVREDRIGDLTPAIAGWLGHAAPFAFNDHFEPAEGVQRFVAGTPPILSMLSLQGALKTFEDVDLKEVERKTQRLGDMCLSVFGKLGLTSTSPPIGIRRGGHVSLIHADGYAVSQALSKRGIKTDFRTPDTIRLGLSPLFLSYSDVWRALDALAEILRTKEYLNAEYSVRSKVT